MLWELVLKCIPKSLKASLKFYNFSNAITLCYMTDDQLNVIKVNKNFLQQFKLSLDEVIGQNIINVFKKIGITGEDIHLFEQCMAMEKRVKLPEVKISNNGEPKFYSLYSVYTKDLFSENIYGAQGQFIDITNEVKLRDEATQLTSSLLEMQNELEQKNKNLEELSYKLAKYLSPQIYQSIFSGEKQTEIHFERKKLSVFFSDIKNFTNTTESMDAEDLAYLLNNYLDQMAQIAIKYGGTIDKFIGDAIMIFFGDPVSRGEKEDALLCVKMALEMRRLMIKLRDEWFSKGFSYPLHIRCGINTGYCIVGNFGSKDRLAYTIVGNSVNLASRLETSAEDDTILISHETYGLVRDEILCKPKGEFFYKGMSRVIKTYEVIDTYENIQNENLVLEKKLKGFSLELDVDNIEKPEEVTLLLRDAIKLLDTLSKS